MKLTYSQNQLAKISDIICDDIELLFDTLQFPLKHGAGNYYGRCFHGGDNRHSLNFYANGHSMRGFWRCHSKSCEKIFRPTVIGLARGIMSAQQYGWTCQTDRYVTFDNTLKFLLSLYKIDIQNLKVQVEDLDKRKFLQQTGWYMPAKAAVKLIEREKVRAKLSYPDLYFASRGFSPEILDKYDVGYCHDMTKFMFGRSVVPIYDEDYKYMLSSVGRTNWEVTEKNPKWKNGPGFNNSLLYNTWFAKPFIKQSHCVVLVESVGNVWRLEEAGIHNSLALFGCNFSDSQQMFLERNGVMKVILLMDEDPAGIQARKEIRQEIKNFYNVVDIHLDSGDVADHSVEEIRAIVNPFLA